MGRSGWFGRAAALLAALCLAAPAAAAGADGLCYSVDYDQWICHPVEGLPGDGELRGLLAGLEIVPERKRPKAGSPVGASFVVHTQFQGQRRLIQSYEDGVYDLEIGQPYESTPELRQRLADAWVSRNASERGIPLWLGLMTLQKIERITYDGVDLERGSGLGRYYYLEAGSPGQQKLLERIVDLLRGDGVTVEGGPVKSGTHAAPGEDGKPLDTAVIEIGFQTGVSYRLELTESSLKIYASDLRYDLTYQWDRERFNGLVGALNAYAAEIGDTGRIIPNT